MMKRRDLLGSLAAIPALTAIPSPAQTATAEEFPKLATTRPEAVGEPSPHFFKTSQMSALRKLAALLVPHTGTRPGALEAGAPEFLDFLIGESPPDRRALYESGLNGLEAGSQQRFGKSFATLSDTDAAILLSPLETPWTYQGPADDLSRFLFAAKEDILRATMNSRQFVTATGGRRATGMGTYWLPLE